MDKVNTMHVVGNMKNQKHEETTYGIFHRVLIDPHSRPPLALSQKPVRASTQSFPASKVNKPQNIPRIKIVIALICNLGSTWVL